MSYSLIYRLYFKTINCFTLKRLVGLSFEDVHILCCIASNILKVADSLIRVSRQLGITTTAVITEMDNPLGKAVGNALEVSV